MSNNEQEYRIIDGKKVPVMPAKATVTVKHKRTGAAYTSKAHFDADVANPETDTVLGAGNVVVLEDSDILKINTTAQPIDVTVSVLQITRS